MNELKETVQLSFLDETPTVLSSGRRCMKMGILFTGFVEIEMRGVIAIEPYLKTS